MKALVSALAGLVRRQPVAVIVVTIVISMVLGGLSGNFTPEEDSNASFAPEAAELTAAEDIGDLFGDDSTVAVMQVIVSNEGGNVFSVDGLNAVNAISETVFSGSLGDQLVDQGGGAIFSFMAPVQFAMAEGAPAPSSDAELAGIFGDALGQLPTEQAGFVEAMLPASGDISAPSSNRGLMIIFTAGAEDTDDIARFVDDSAAAADEIIETALPAGFTAEPFSFELLFADQDEFQAEIGRLFGTAALIIIVVLALVFLVKPRGNPGRYLLVGGLTLVVAAIVMVVLPTLATILDSVFPDALKDLDSNIFFMLAGLALFATFLAWTFADRGLRRTAADTMLTMVVIFFAISWMNGIGYLLFTDASPMAQILPILLIGLGVDYSIHVTSRYREEVSSGASVDDAIGSAIRTVGVALVLATMTTMVGFLTNVFNPLPALREFGVLAAIGIFASFILMLTFIPAVREVLDRRGHRLDTLEPERLVGGEDRALGNLIGKTSGIAKKSAAVAVTVALVLGVFGFIGYSNLSTKFSFLDFIPTTSPLRVTFETLLDEFGGGFGETTAVLIQGDVATAEAWNAMVSANGGLVDTTNVVTFAGQPAGSSPIAAIGGMISEESPFFVPSVAQAMQAAGVDQSFMVPAGADIAAVYDAAFAAAPDAVSGVLHQADGGGYDAALFDFTTQAGESGASQLQQDVLADFMPVSDAGLSAVATSDEIINDVIVTTLRDSQFSSLIQTIVAALLLLMINFWFEARRPMLGVITTVPVILTVLWSFGLMTVFGIPFGPVTATISALAIGIGIPYMIHITHRFLEDRERTNSVGEAIELTLANTGGALAGSALTTVAGFGILVTSTTIPFRQFGFVTAYTILLAMLTAVLVLPSMLVLWSRWHEKRGS